MNRKLEINSKAKALIFDLDGTLADTMPVHFWAYKNVLKEHGIEFTPELFGTLAGISAPETIRVVNEMFGTSMDTEETAHIKETAYKAVMHKMKPIAPVVDLVKKYHGVLPMAVGTGGNRRLAWKSLEIIGLADYFEILVSADDITHSKPHPETFLKCAELMGVQPEVCQVFEDGEPGIRAAEAAGMMHTLVTDFYQVRIGEEI